METEHATSTLAQHTPGAPEAEANARLIAATPELLDMLRACSRVFNDPNFTDRAGYGDLINAIINKAEGN